jgi:hypothetical protein
MSGVPGNGASFLNSTYLSSMTPDGRYVAFESSASDLVPNDINGSFRDIFVRDLVAGTTILVSANCNGAGGGNDNSYDPTISADGRFVAFESYAWDLAPGQFVLYEENIFRRDLFTGTTELLSRNRNLTGGGIYSSYYAAISADGRSVAFESYAYDLVNGDLNDTDDIFVWRGVIASNCPPGISMQPQSQSVAAGANVSFSVGVNSCGASSYQWYFQMMPVAGGTAPTLSLFNVGASNAGNYFVVLSNAFGSITSAVATLTVTNAPGTNFNIVSIEMTNGAPSIVFMGTPGQTYQVQRTTNLIEPILWTTLWSTSAPAGGLFWFIDPSPPTNSAFYRSARP